MIATNRMITQLLADRRSDDDNADASGEEPADAAELRSAPHWQPPVNGSFMSPYLPF